MPDIVAISKNRPWHPPVPRGEICRPDTVIDLVGKGPVLTDTFQVVEQGFVFTYHETPYWHYVDPETGHAEKRIQLSLSPVVTWTEPAQ